MLNTYKTLWKTSKQLFKIPKANVTYHKQKEFAFSAKELFCVVNDVEKYKHFVPFCEDSKIEQTVSENEFYARLTANFKVYHDSYLSHVTSKSYGKGDYTIVSKADSGMFKFLNSTWDIKNEGPNKCFVDYNLEFEFNNFLYQSVSGMVLDVVGAKTLEAFEQRVYDIRKIIGTCEQKAEAAESHPIGKTLLHPETAPKKVPLSARLLKPRRNVDLKVKKLDSKSVLHDLYKLAEANKIEKDKFNTILDSFEKDEFIKNSIKNLFSLWKQESISERQFLFYLNEFLTMHVH